jgi:hypothetical protein
MTTQTDKCMHPSCNCPAMAGADYCSDECIRNKDDLESGCQCGHPECQTTVLPAGAAEPRKAAS